MEIDRRKGVRDSLAAATELIGKKIESALEYAQDFSITEQNSSLSSIGKTESLVLALLYSLLTADEVLSLLFISLLPHLYSSKYRQLKIWLELHFSFNIDDLNEAKTFALSLNSHGNVRVPDTLLMLLFNTTNKSVLHQQDGDIDAVAHKSSNDKRRREDAFQLRNEVTIVFKDQKRMKRIRLGERNPRQSDIAQNSISETSQVEIVEGCLEDDDREASEINTAVPVSVVRPLIFLSPKEAHASLVKAVENNDPAAIRTCVAAGADVNLAFENGDRLLHMAAQTGMMEAAKALLDAGAVVDAEGRHGWTPSFRAVWEGRLPILKLFLCHRANLNWRYLQGDGTLLHLAAVSGQTHIAAWLLDSGISPETRDSHGYTPLHWASRWDHKNMIRLLLDKGAEIDPKSNSGWTPLHSCARRGHHSTIQLLLDQGAYINMRTNRLLTPLHYAGTPEIASLLRSRGAIL